MLLRLANQRLPVSASGLYQRVRNKYFLGAALILLQDCLRPAVAYVYLYKGICGQQVNSCQEPCFQAYMSLPSPLQVAITRQLR